MGDYILWKYAHLLMFVFWLGTDMGVFIAARRAVDPKLPFATRALLLHLALRIELLPRTMWKAALPLGVTLSREVGLLPLDLTGLLLVWAGSLAWWGISMTGAWYYDRPLGHRLGRLTDALTVAVGVGVIILAVTSALGHGPVSAHTGWLHWKIGLYGLINLMVVLMLRTFDPMGAAFGSLAAEGSTPATEAIIARTMMHSSIVIWATYGLIALVAFIGTAKWPA